MSVLEAYETAETLRQLKKNVALSNHTVRCLVTSTIPTRRRENRDGFVFTAEGVLHPQTGADVKKKMDTVKINFYNEWAYGASFLDVGDVLILKGFIILEAPSLPALVVGSDEAKPAPFLAALKSDSRVRVLQTAGHIEPMEVTVTPETIENPCVRVLPRHDNSNQKFISDTKKRAQIAS